MKAGCSALTQQALGEQWSPGWVRQRTEAGPWSEVSLSESRKQVLRKQEHSQRASQRRASQVQLMAGDEVQGI